MYGVLPQRGSQALTHLVEVSDVYRRFGPTEALSAVTLSIESGQIHSLLGPNGAGKTTLLRIIAGLTAPTSGHVRILGRDPVDRSVRQQIGWVPAADRTFYLRISGFENLLFFGRLYGLRSAEAARIARSVLAQVGLTDAADKRVGLYSHGMQKRLLMARALLADPKVLVVDEATHDLDPRGADTIRSMVKSLADNGAAVIWATQRITEIRGFSDNVTVLHGGRTRFSGSVTDLIDRAFVTSYVLRLMSPEMGRDSANARLAGRAVLEPVPEEPGRYLLRLKDGVALGDALAIITGAGITVTHCREATSDLEQAFLLLTEEADG